MTLKMTLCSLGIHCLCGYRWGLRIPRGAVLGPPLLLLIPNFTKNRPAIFGPISPFEIDQSCAPVSSGGLSEVPLWTAEWSRVMKNTTKSSGGCGCNKSGSVWVQGVRSADENSQINKLYLYMYVLQKNSALSSIHWLN